MFNPLSDGFDGYDHAVKLLSLQDVLTKEVETLTPETEEEFGNDPVLIFKGDIGISGGYMNIVFMQNLPPKPSIVSVLCVRKMMRIYMERTVTYIWNSAIMTMRT